MIAELIRLEQSENETIGILRLNKKVFCYTLELKYAENKKNISCIPAKQYTVARIISRKFGDVFKVKNVINRTNILFHVGNTADDTAGCILLGSNVDYTKSGKRMITNSVTTFSRFMGILKKLNSFNLTITEVF